VFGDTVSKSNGKRGGEPPPGTPCFGEGSSCGSREPCCSGLQCSVDVPTAICVSPTPPPPPSDGDCGELGDACDYLTNRDCCYPLRCSLPDGGVCDTGSSPPPPPPGCLPAGECSEDIECCSGVCPEDGFCRPPVPPVSIPPTSGNSGN